METLKDDIEQMIEKEVINRLEKLKDIEWGTYSRIKQFIDSLPEKHCLRLLSLSDLHRNENRKFLSQLEATFKLMERETSDNKKWFLKKLEEIKNIDDRKQVSSNLGELRAYSILKLSELGRNLKCMLGDGCDFTTEVTINNTNQKVKIEVNTPLENDNEEETTIDFGCTKSIIEGKGSISTAMKEVAPFGLPEREGKDSIGSEVISKINRIKYDEHQFSKDTINILFVDFVNPFLSDGLDILGKHCSPFQIFNDEIFFGNIWYSLYSKKSELVPFQRPFYYPLGEKPYVMEYDGRLIQRDKLTDFIIFNMYSNVSIFEKNAEHNIKPSKEFYLSLLTIKNIEWNSLWINYPNNDLSERIQYIKNIGLFLEKDCSYIDDYE